MAAFCYIIIVENKFCLEVVNMKLSMKEKCKAVANYLKRTYETHHDTDKFSFTAWSIQCIAKDVF
jgi:hypothetical protein